MNSPKVGVGVIVVKNGKVLLGKRKTSHGDGTWCFVGGHLEFGEDPIECAKREAFEEAGITLKNIRFLTITNDVYPDQNKHYVTLFMIAEHDDGEPSMKEPERFSETWKWVEWANMPRPLFKPIENLLAQGYNPFN